MRILQLSDSERMRVDLVALLPGIRLPHYDSALFRFGTLQKWCEP